jgi:hypothetical protein
MLSMNPGIKAENCKTQAMNYPVMMTESSAASETKRLTSLTTWSHEHIRAVFEAETDAEALLAISSTFSPTVQVTFNGSPLTREEISHLVLMIRKSSKDGEGKGVKVKWLQSVEVPTDESNRVRVRVGFYHQLI